MDLTPPAESFLLPQRCLLLNHSGQIFKLRVNLFRRSASTVLLRLLPLVVGLLGDVIVFVGSETLEEVGQGEHGPRIERIGRVLIPSTLTDYKVGLALILLVDLQEAMQSLTLVVFIVDKAPLDQELHK